MCLAVIADRLSQRLLVMLVGVASALMLAVALIGQYGFDLYPCDLCIYQRIPYGMLAGLGLLAYFVKKQRLLYMMAWLCVWLLAVETGIAFYHTGVELGWFPGLSGCSNDTSIMQTIEEMRRAIMNAPLVTCDQAMIEVLGLSMAAWNALAAAAMTVMVFLLVKRINHV